MTKPRISPAKLLIIFLFLTAVFSACRSTGKSVESETSAQASEETFDVSAPNINLAKPLEISQKPEDIALAKKIDEIIDKSEFTNARWGVFVVSLKDGRVLVSRDGRKLFNPASIQKTLTAIVALDKLGADFRFKTFVFAPNQIDASGNLNGDLTLYGTGAPDFDDEALGNLIAQLQAKGLRHVKGNVVGDDSYFKGDEIGDGWTWNDLQWHYGAEASALSFKENQAGVFMNTDGKPAASTDLLEIHGELKPAAKGETEAFGIKRGLEDNQIYVWGSGDKAYGKISVHNPAFWAAKTLKEALEKKGITIDGEVRSADWKTENRSDAASETELAAVESKTLAELVQRMNKHSVNLYGELLLRTIGKKFGDAAPDESRQIQEIRGDDSAGASVVKKWLTEKKVFTDEIEIHDGSGLSRLDFVTPEAFVRALIYAAQSNFAQVFKDSLPIAGTDGTLGGRLWKVKGKILAKTGTITYVNSLTGYAQKNAAEAPDKSANKSNEKTSEKPAANPDGETLAFAIICNNQTRKSESTRVIDQIAASLVDSLSGEEGNEKGKVKSEK